MSGRKGKFKAAKRGREQADAAEAAKKTKKLKEKEVIARKGKVPKPAVKASGRKKDGKEKKKKDMELPDTSGDTMYLPVPPLPPPMPSTDSANDKKAKKKRGPKPISERVTFGLTTEEIESLTTRELVALPMILMGNAYTAMLSTVYDEDYVPPVNKRKMARDEKKRAMKANLNKKWSEEEDLYLVAMKGAGRGFAEIGQDLKRTGRACKTRYHTVCSQPVSTYRNDYASGEESGSESAHSDSE